MGECTCCGQALEPEQPLVFERCKWCSENCTSFHVEPLREEQAAVVMYRHSLFFETIDEAEKAKLWVDTCVENLGDIYLSNDGETGIIECRFFTEKKLSDFNQRYILRRTKTQNYALNAEDN